MQQMKKAGLNVRQSCLIGLGFMVVSLSWSLYTAYVPLILKDKFLLDTLHVSIVMTIDNIFGVVFQPLFGRLSDRTNTKIGKRMPYIIIGAPLAAVLFALVPHMRTLWSVMTVVIVFNLVMSAWRSPVVALMPDLTPSHLRSLGNGVVNLMGGIGSAIALVAGGMLFNLGGMPMPFLVCAILMVAAAAVLFFTVDERAALDKIAAEQERALGSAAPQEQAQEQPKEKSKLTKKEKISLICLLGMIFFAFSGFNALETFFTLYATRTFQHLSEGDATILLAFFAGAYLLMSVPAGLIAARFGRKRCILVGLCVDIICFLLMFFAGSVPLLRVMMVVGGVAWSLVVINALPMVVDMASGGSVGTFTGVYYSASQSASIASPILFGAIMRLTGDQYNLLFLYGAICLAFALFSVLFVRHGEVKNKTGVMDVLASMED